MTDLAATQGDRAKAIREALGLRQDEFAARMNDVARRLGTPAHYDAPKVSRNEHDKRGIAARDALIIAALDPEHRGVTWLVTGRHDPLHGMAGKEPTRPYDPGDSAATKAANGPKRRPK